MAYGYIYKTTNLINGKIYIGQHKYSKNHIDPYYLGGGKNLHLAIKKYGKENFKCEILEWCNSFEELNEKEIYYVDYYRKITICYNIDNGGQWIPGHKHSEETKEKISINNARYWKGKRLPEHVLQASHEAMKKLRAEGKLKGYKPTPEECLERSIRMKEYWKNHIPPNTGRKITEETRQKLIESHLGQIAWNKGANQTEETKKKVSNGLKRYYSTHKRVGYHFTDEEKARISASVTKANTGKKFINNGKINKFVTVEEAEEYFALNEGWIYGRLSSKKFLETRKNLNKGYCWITNGLENKFINPNQLQDYLNKGWKRGMVRNG